MAVTTSRAQLLPKLCLNRFSCSLWAWFFLVMWLPVTPSQQLSTSVWGPVAMESGDEDSFIAPPIKGSIEDVKKHTTAFNFRVCVFVCARVHVREWETERLTHYLLITYSFVGCSSLLSGAPWWPLGCYNCSCGVTIDHSDLQSLLWCHQYSAELLDQLKSKKLLWLAFSSLSSR